MKTPSHAPVGSLPGDGRRRLVRGGIVTACILYVGVLLLLPLVGIVYTALESGPRDGRSRPSAGPTCGTRSSSRA